MSPLQTVDQVASDLSDGLDDLADRVTAELLLRVPEYQRALLAAGDDAKAVCLGSLALLLSGLHDSNLKPTAGGRIRRAGAARCDAGVALDTMVEVVSTERQLLAHAFADAARTRSLSPHIAVLAERRLDKFAAAMIAELARGYLAAVTERARRQQEAMAALVKVAAVINRSLELADVAHAALGAITEALGAEVGILWLRAEDEGDLGLAYTHGLRWDEDRRLRTSPSVKSPLVERAVRAGAAVSGPPLGTNGDLLLTTVAAMALRSRGELLGVIAVGNRPAGAFSHQQLTLLRSASDYLAAALVRARQHRLDARTDALTGLANRAELERQLERAIAGASRHGRPLALLLMDIDGLKEINDEQGHPAGDAALRSLAAILQRSCRAVDTSARIGGDEFIVVMPDTTLADAGEARSRITRAMHTAGLRVSSGIAAWEPSMSAQDLFKMADTRLYREKRRHHRERGLGA